ncbi:MAG: hypothetical protein ACLSUM_10265 [Dysosmobacter welbionis]
MLGLVGATHRRQDGNRPLPGKSVSREGAERLLAFCNNSNPVFLISVLGVGCSAVCGPGCGCG